MPRLATAGTVPGSIVENAGPADWVASLALVGDLAGLVEVVTLGPDAHDFAVRLDRAAGTVALSPAAPLDFEAFAAAGLPPQVTLALGFRFNDGSLLADAASYPITVLNLDDTPPEALAFLSGGSVAAGDPGAVIGRLLVTDPDSTGPYLFSFGDADAWRFEVVGDTLRLQSGISLGLDDIPDLPLIVTVSDGRQSAAFTLDITVTPPPGGDGRIDSLALPGPRAGYALALHDGGTDTGLLSSTGVTYSARSLYGAAAGPDGAPVHFMGVEVLEFADGRLVFDPGDRIFQVERLYLSALGRSADPLGLHGWTEALRAGHPLAELAQAFVGCAEFQARNPAIDAVSYVTLLYRNTLGRDPDAGGLADWSAAMQAGSTRADLLERFSESAENYARTATLWADGLFDYDETGAAVARLYSAAFGRLPDMAGWAHWVAEVEAGLPLTQLAAMFPQSAEFQQRYAAPDDAGYVDLLYRNALGRAPDQGGLAYWTGQLASGAVDRSGLLLDFSECFEHQAQTVAQVANGVLFA
jgi:hypothetical protein